MAGGGYNHGIYDCGPTAAMAAAKAGLAKTLIDIAQSDEYVSKKLEAWRKRLINLLPASKIPPQFPERAVLDLYVRPTVSSEEQLHKLKGSIRWNKPVDVKGLQIFTKQDFNWLGRSYARKFILVLGPALLAHRLLLHSQQEEDETVLFNTIKAKKRRPGESGKSPDEIQIEFVPQDIVGTDWEAEPYMPEHYYDEAGTFKPGKLATVWIPDFFVMQGAPALWIDSASTTTSKLTKGKNAVAQTKAHPPRLLSTHLPSGSVGVQKILLRNRRAKTKSKTQPSQRGSVAGPKRTLQWAPLMPSLRPLLSAPIHGLTCMLRIMWQMHPDPTRLFSVMAMILNRIFFFGSCLRGRLLVRG